MDVETAVWMGKGCVFSRLFLLEGNRSRHRDRLNGRKQRRDQSWRKKG